MTALECTAEALLFAAGEPITIDQIARVLEVEPKEAEEACENLRALYDREHRGMQLLRLEKAYQLSTRPEDYPIVQKMYRSSQKITLSEAQLETLAIVAYKQPVTKQEIEDIRGVRSDAVINRLVDYNLVMEKGRKKAPGRPMLFGTTNEFLRSFGLASVKDLPHLDPVNQEALEQLRLEAAAEPAQTAEKEG